MEWLVVEYSSNVAESRSARIYMETNHVEWKET